MSSDLDNVLYYENRELSWLEFNQRVLDEAKNENNPIFERIKFLSIVSSNMDEFFMVRVASLKEQVKAGYDKPDFSGLRPKMQLKKISQRVHILVKEQYEHLNKYIIPNLKENGIHLLKSKELNNEQIDYVRKYYKEVLYPVLTPMAVDSSRPFPLIYNKSLNLATLIKKDNEEMFATVQVPSVLPRLVELPKEEGKEKIFILLEDIIKKYIKELFIGYEVISVFSYRITRNSDLSIDEEEAQDLLTEIEESIKKRRFGDAIRLEVAHDMDTRLIKILKIALSIHEKDIYMIEGPLDLTFFYKMYQLKSFQQLKYVEYKPQYPKDLLGKHNIFNAIKEKDILLHHPYESFEPVVEFIKTAVKDSKVLAIKQTLYRVSGNSPIIKALAKAAESGKQVTVLVELKARFDEENNIQWAKKLEKAGCHVIYGLVGLKTHSKITLVVRMEEDGVRRYVHLGTGNYNDITAKFYTDLGLLTCDAQMGSDASAVFNTLSGYSEPPKLNRIVMAPIGLRKKFIQLIQNEIMNAKAGKKAKIIAKMNSLCDKEIMKKIYEASVNGVKIELIVRGICCLIPDIEKISENINITSIVGRYLEHSRVFYFYDDGKESIYLSSADWMPRNLNRRIELLFPIRETHIKERIKNILDIDLKDNVKAKKKNKECLYNKEKKTKELLNAQDYFMNEAFLIANKYHTQKDKALFPPISNETKRKNE